MWWCCGTMTANMAKIIQGHLLQITLTMSFQHYPRNFFLLFSFFQFLVNQYWKCRNNVLTFYFFRFPLFQYMHRSICTHKIYHDRNTCELPQWVHVYQQPYSKRQFFRKDFLFLSNLLIQSIVFGEIRNRELDQNADFSKTSIFVAQNVLHALCS